MKAIVYIIYYSLISEPSQTFTETFIDHEFKVRIFEAHGTDEDMSDQLHAQKCDAYLQYVAFPPGHDHFGDVCIYDVKTATLDE